MWQRPHSEPDRVAFWLGEVGVAFQPQFHLFGVALRSRIEQPHNFTNPW